MLFWLHSSANPLAIFIHSTNNVTLILVCDYRYGFHSRLASGLEVILILFLSARFSTQLQMLIAYDKLTQ